jgi:hypothetical protein
MISPEPVLSSNMSEISDSKTMTRLSVNGMFTGNYDDLLNSGRYGSYSLFYVTDGAGKNYGWTIVDPEMSEGTVEVVFDVSTGAPLPYVMHTSADKTWSFDLALK